MKQISIELRNVYGAIKAYPACDSAEQFAHIAGTKTLTTRTLKHALLLGYAVQVLGRNGCVIMPGSNVTALALSE